MNDQTFSDRLRALRNKANLSAAELAIALNEKFPNMQISESVVNDWELDELPVGQDMANLAEFFDVEPAYLQFGLVAGKPDERLSSMFAKFSALTSRQQNLVNETIDEFDELNRSSETRKQR